jgi:hypothetical protein
MLGRNHRPHFRALKGQLSSVARPLAAGVWTLILAAGPLAGPRAAASPLPRETKTAMSVLFREEIAKAPTRLKWRGERLSDDTLYAVALTGASWELAWGKDPMFSLAWGSFPKAPATGSQNNQDYVGVVHEVQKLYEQKQYREAVQTAIKNFTLDQIGCDVFLKEPVGLSFMALGQPEQAFPIFAAPFEPPHSQGNVAQLDRRFRELALDSAQHAGLTRETVAFALSLLLDPGADAPRLHAGAIEVLDAQGVDIDRVLLGILAAPERLRGLPAYSYAAADLLSYRVSPRLIPALLHLANSDDAYLRSRALLSLGIVAYQSRPDDPADWAAKVAIPPVREYGLSAVQRRMIEKELREGANCDRYRVRAAAALAIALAAPDDAEAMLHKLAKDRDYVLSTPPSAPADSRVRRIEYPVRFAAAAALARFGEKIDVPGGDLEGRALDAARRGGQDATNDRRGLRKDVASQVAVSPLDPYLAAPLGDSPHR